GGIGVQHWRDNLAAPVLCSDWPMQDGVVMRTEVFTHMEGGGEVVTGTEPLYAWVRLSVAYVHPIRPPEKYFFTVRLSKDYYDVTGTLDDSVFLLANPSKAPIRSPLSSKIVAGSASAHNGAQIEQSNQVRLLVLPGGDGNFSLAETSTNSGIYNLKIELPARVGAHTDLLVPILPFSEAETADEATLGFDGALAQANTYWSKKPATAAYIHTPEKYINDAIQRNIQFAQIVAERNPDTGEYSFLSGS